MESSCSSSNARPSTHIRAAGAGTPCTETPDRRRKNDPGHPIRWYFGRPGSSRNVRVHPIPRVMTSDASTTPVSTSSSRSRCGLSDPRIFQNPAATPPDYVLIWPRPEQVRVVLFWNRAFHSVTLGLHDTARLLIWPRERPRERGVGAFPSRRAPTGCLGGRTPRIRRRGPGSTPGPVRGLAQRRCQGVNGTAGSRTPGCPPSIRCRLTSAAPSRAACSSARPPVSRFTMARFPS